MVSEEVTPESKILRALRDQVPDVELQSIFDGYVIVQEGEKFFRVNFSGDPEKVLFEPKSAWAEVDLEFQEKPKEGLKGDEPMAVELSAEQITAIAVQVAAINKEKPADSLSSILNLEGLSDEAKAQRKVELQSQLNAIRKEAELEYRAEMARLAHENTMTELSQRLTQGTQDAPRALQVSFEELKAHLLKLPQDEAKFWGELLTKTQKDGMVEFKEMGSNHQPKGTHPLPVEVVAKLKSGELKVADLESPILGLGDLDQYDLSAWQK